MPQFDGLQALAVVAARCPNLPFILVSGAIGEETAVQAMKSGAHDYVLKGDLSRLILAVRRGLADADTRRARRLAESNLRSSEALLNSIVNTAADVIIVTDEAGVIEFVNDAVERMFGWKPLELIGRNVECLMAAGRRSTSDSAMPRNVAWHKAHMPDLGRDLRMQKKDGSMFAAELKLNEMRVEGRTSDTGILRDIGDRKTRGGAHPPACPLRRSDRAAQPRAVFAAPRPGAFRNPNSRISRWPSCSSIWTTSSWSTDSRSPTIPATRCCSSSPGVFVTESVPRA